ncbi:MAG: histone deacetylase [Deltaproteobacteria bacterium]|nr:histone deacetylase [Deltaproteobacteria bacterium]
MAGRDRCPRGIPAARLSGSPRGRPGDDDRPGGRSRGVASAELGGLRIIYSPGYFADLGGHVFPIQKYRLVHERLLREGVIAPAAVLEPQPAPLEDLLLVHTPAYVQDLLTQTRSPRTMFSEMPLTLPIVEAFRLATGGTILAAEQALERQAAVNLGGGLHHAFPDHAEGFCYFNDVAIAIRRLERAGRIRRSLVVDCDLHQGNGTAFIFRNDPAVFTFSVHQENLYPVKQTGDLDIGLDDFAGDEEYLDALRRTLPGVFRDFRPDLVFYVAGADPYGGDQLGTLQISLPGLCARDEFVLELCRKHQAPVAVVLAGGYAEKTEDTITIHVNTCRVAAALFT